MKLRITREVIRKGLLEGENPVVTAIRDTIPEDVRISTIEATPDLIAVGGVIYTPPRKLGHFIRRYERGLTLKPLIVQVGS